MRLMPLSQDRSRNPFSPSSVENGFLRGLCEVVWKQELAAPAGPRSETSIARVGNSIVVVVPIRVKPMRRSILTFGATSSGLEPSPVAAESRWR